MPLRSTARVFSFLTKSLSQHRSELFLRDAWSAPLIACTARATPSSAPGRIGRDRLGDRGSSGLMEPNVIAVISVFWSIPDPSSATAIQEEAPFSLTVIRTVVAPAEMLLSIMSASALPGRNLSAHGIYQRRGVRRNLVVIEHRVRMKVTLQTISGGDHRHSRRGPLDERTAAVARLAPAQPSDVIVSGKRLRQKRDAHYYAGDLRQKPNGLRQLIAERPSRRCYFNWRAWMRQGLDVAYTATRDSRACYFGDIVRRTWYSGA